MSPTSAKGAIVTSANPGRVERGAVLDRTAAAFLLARDEATACAERTFKLLEVARRAVRFFAASRGGQKRRAGNGAGGAYLMVERELSAALARVIRQVSKARSLIEPLCSVFDEQSRGPFTIYGFAATNAHLAALQFAQAAVAQYATSQFDLWDKHYLVTYGEEAGEQYTPNERNRREAEDLALRLDSFARVDDVDVDRLVCAVRLESAAAMKASGQPGGKGAAMVILGGEILLIIEALRRAGRPLHQEELLNAAKLTVDGTHKHTLSLMVQLGLLTNSRREGYSLTERCPQISPT